MEEAGLWLAGFMVTFIQVWLDGWPLWENWRNIADSLKATLVVTLAENGLDRIRSKWRKEWRELESITTESKLFMLFALSCYGVLIVWAGIAAPDNPPLAVTGSFVGVILAYMVCGVYCWVKQLVRVWQEGGTDG